MDESANLFDYDDGTDKNKFNEKAREFGLIGTGNPEQPDTIDLRTIADEGESNIKLYPVYAVRGFDNVVTANDDTARAGKRVVGISDWKAYQGEDHYYQNLKRERWLGSVNIEVYKDGEPWVESELMYFSYHNDDAVDLNIKFIWDELVDTYKGDDPLFLYMSDNDTFPKYDQVGHFIIDGVYATQGGSENGLY